MFKQHRNFLRAFVKERKLQGDDGEFSVYQIDINAESFNSMPVNDSWFVQLTMHRKRVVGDKWDTHYITQWIPKPKIEYGENGETPMGHVAFK